MSNSRNAVNKTKKSAQWADVIVRIIVLENEIIEFQPEMLTSCLLLCIPGWPLPLMVFPSIWPSSFYLIFFFFPLSVSFSPYHSLSLLLSFSLYLSPSVELFSLPVLMFRKDVASYVP